MKALHNGGSIAVALGRSLDYIGNDDKTNGGELVVGYECDPFTAQSEFLFSKQLYTQKTGRDQGKNNVIAYHIRMSFKHDEVTAEQALELGRELGLRWTKGKHQFIVAAHTNTKNPHAHIVFNSVNLDCDGKFQDFKRSAITLRRLSDQICLENGLSIIEKPGLSKGFNRKEYLHKPKLLIDVQAKMQQGYGAGFEKWAKLQNLKESAKTLLFLQENGINDYDLLVEKADVATKNFNRMSARTKQIESRQSEISSLQRHIGAYLKTKDIYAEYKRQKFSKKFYAENEKAISVCKTSKTFFNEQNLKKLPTIKMLQAEYAKLEAEKKKLYANYKPAREEMIALKLAKQNVDIILGKRNISEKFHERGAR